MDPILPLCMLSACLRAYTGFRTEEIDYNKEDRTLRPTDGAVNADDCESPGPSEAECHSTLASSTQNTVISTFLQDIGEGLQRLGPKSNMGASERETWWDDEIYLHEHSTTQEASMKDSNNTSNFLKDVKKKFSSIFSSQATTNSSSVYWDGEFDLISLDSEDGSTSPESDISGANGTSTAPTNQTEASCSEPHFKVKLANNFTPLKSQCFGQRMKVHHTALVKNPYISPALASDEMLATLPSVDLVGCEFDPLFDDCVTIARRLHDIGHDHEFHVVRGQPHGFLSLQMCKETREASNMCLRLLKKRFFSSGTSSP